jgi:hypothetical protein
MRLPSLIELTGSAASKGARVAAMALLVTAFAAQPALAQSGGVSAPGSGGVPAPDPAPTPAPPAPDPAPTPDSDRVEAAPSPQTAPAPPDTTYAAPRTSPPVIAAPSASAASESAAVERAGQPRRRRAGKRAREARARDRRSARPEHPRSTAGRASPASVFGVNPLLAGAAGRDTDTDADRPVELIAWALLALVLAAAALLTLTARLWRMEGITAPMPHDSQWLQRILQIAHFAPRGTGRPAS